MKLVISDAHEGIKAPPPAAVHDMAALPGVFPKERAGACWQEQPASRVGLHRHCLRPARLSRGEDPVLPGRRPDEGKAKKARRLDGRRRGGRACLNDLSCQRRSKIRPRGGAKVVHFGHDWRLGSRALHIACGCRGALVRQDQVRFCFRSFSVPCSGPGGSCRRSSPEWRRGGSTDRAKHR